MSTSLPAAPKTYSFYTDLVRAGWKRNFDISGGGHYCVSVSGAPSLGSSPGGKLYAGHWTAPDGTSMFQRSNMDRSVSTLLLDPMGRQLEFFICDTLIEAEIRLRSLDLI